MTDSAANVSNGPARHARSQPDAALMQSTEQQVLAEQRVCLSCVCADKPAVVQVWPQYVARTAAAGFSNGSQLTHAPGLPLQRPSRVKLAAPAVAAAGFLARAPPA